MTYLLKSEVDLQDERKRYEQLSAKFETLNSLLAPDSAVPNIADFAPIAASSASFTAPFSAPQISAEHDTSGIAFEQHDLYPQPVWADHSRQFVSSQEHSQYEEYSGIASSSSTSSALRSLAQQYAQDAYYPVPGDRDDDEEVEKVQQSGVYASLDRARAGAGAGGSAGTHANPPYAQYTSTPARFQEKMIAGASIAAGKGAKLAANPVPGAMLTTPMQAQDGRSNLHHAYNSVSSTCSTPPMSLLHKKFVYSTANMLPPPSTQESAQKMHPFAHITSPKPYVDAYVSYLQSAPALGSEQQRSTSSTSAVASADLSTPKKGNPVTSHAAASAMLLGQTDSHSSETDDSTMSAGLSRLDELIRYSKSIANTSYTVGDEFSTIARLTNHHSGGAADDSILHSPDSTYLQQTQAQSPRPLAADSVNVYQHMYSSRESEFSLPPPPPPPPSSLPCGDVLEKHGAPLRQPDAASASRLHLQQQQQQQYLSVQQKVPIISTSSVLAANPNSALAANMTGASPSDWLFHNFTAKPVPPSVSHAHSEQHKSASDSLPITPEGVFSPPSSAQQQSVGMVTPSRDFIKVNVPAPQPTVNLKTGAINTKLRSPATRDLFNQQQAGSGGSTGSDSRFHTHDDASTTDETVNRLAEQTSHLFAPDVSPALAPRAAVPPYLLEQQQMQKKKSAQIKIAKPVQSIVHRNPSPCKKSAVPKRVTLSASARSPQQEQTSIIMPHSKVPSPQSAPIHPYAGSSHSLAHQTYQQKLQSLQGEMEESNRSNETTPVLKLNRWAPPALVFDATSGSF